MTFVEEAKRIRKQMIGGTTLGHGDAIMVLGALIDVVEAHEHAIRKYARHRACDSANGDEACSCGLDKLLEEIGNG